jgi:hypothetical protein
MKKFKNLYVNGCSFTAGDNIKQENIWPVLLAKKLNLNLINQSKNANSLQSIVFTSVNHLSTLNKDDTLVVIGLTWPPRYMIQFKNSVVNITPVDVDKKGPKPIFGSNFSKNRRMSSAVLADERKIGDFFSEINLDETDIVLGNFAKYYKSLLRYDTDIKRNQDLNYISNLVLFQSFLKENNFNYKFISFDVNILGSIIDVPIMSKIDNTKILLINDIPKDGTSHPTVVGCEYISEMIFEDIYDSFNR